MTGTDVIMRAAQALRDGALVIMPTDTVYGVAAASWIPGAIQKLYEVKGRDPDKPIPLLADSLETVESCGAELGASERKLALRCWPGPLTLVLKLRSQSAPGESFLSPHREGFRVPDHDLALALLREVGGVLRVTSANCSGEPPALTENDARAALGNAVAAVVDGGPVPGGTPSTVVEIRDGELVIHREGAFSREDLLAILA